MSNYIVIQDRDGDCKRKDCACGKKYGHYKDNDSKRTCGCETCKQLHPKARGVIEVCGMQGSDIVVTDLATTDPPVEITRATIDTSCLCNPQVIIDFCSFITAVQTATIVLSKECENIPKHQLAAFNYSSSVESDIVSFCFKFCDFNTSCTGCCSYIVELVQASTFNNGGNITQGAVTAKAQGACMY